MNNSQFVLDGYIVSWVDKNGNVRSNDVTEIDEARSLAASVVNQSTAQVIILGFDGCCYDW
mgnify:CR=1 FL=1|jgi:hypothetical protein